LQASALFNNSTGSNNAAAGASALACNTTGGYNTAVGPFALASDATSGGFPYPLCKAGFGTGSSNTALGAFALTSNTTANNNTASGLNALYANRTGNSNSAFGANSLKSDSSGSNNAAFGNYALFHSTGSTNLGLGANAGYNLTGGSNNVDIANQGLAGDTGIIRIGAPSTQTATYIAGIQNSKLTGSAVYVTSSGQLGVLASSQRYKTAIAPMGDASERLRRLQAVSFHLKSEPRGAVQYGLIAEDVDKIYPELVIRDEQGRIEGVRYDELAPMLLNETQKLQSVVAVLAAQHAADVAALDAQAARIASLEQQFSVIEAALERRPMTEPRVAQR
jgi:trimeric autotransporter adhesin